MTILKSLANFSKYTDGDVAPLISCHNGGHTGRCVFHTPKQSSFVVYIGHAQVGRQRYFTSDSFFTIDCLATCDRSKQGTRAL